MRCLLFAVASAVLGSAFAGNTYYLVPEGTPGNTPTAPYNSWETAANELADITDGIQTGVSGHQILIRPGTYYPTRQALFPDGWWCTDMSIRSCDPETGKTDEEGTVFDGSRMTPNADGTIPRMIWFGLFNVNFDLRGLTFRNAGGGAVRVNNGNTPFTVADCTFVDNVTTNDRGGALYSFCNAGVVSNCVFRGNRAINSSGGAFSSWMNGASSEVKILDCLFADNEITGDGNGGGSVYANNSGLLTVSGCTFTGTCGGSYGSVINCEGLTKARFADNVFTNLTSTNPGYALLICSKGNDNVGPHEVENCTFVDCTAAPSLFNLYGTDFIVRNSLFACTDNSCVRPFWCWTGTFQVENCSLSGFQYGHNFQGDATEHVTYVNCILPTRANCEAKTTLENCYVTSEGGDPFISTLTGDWRLSKGSACIDAGKALDWHADAADLGGRDRVVGAAVDIGCYERQADDPAHFYYRAVQSEADKTGRWADATVGIQAAIDAAPSGAYVGIRSGVWNVEKTITVYNKTLTICGLNAETDEIDRDGTILDGGKARRIMQATNRSNPVFDQGTAEGVDVGQMAGTVVVEGLTFRNGNAAAGTTTDEGGVIRDADGHRTDNNGGGLWLRGKPEGAYGASRARNCKFVGNTAKGAGGMYLLWGGFAEDCLFVENEATEGSGGGLCVHDWAGGRVEDDALEATFGVDPTAVRCEFRNNVAAACGGGMGDSAGFCWFRMFAVDCLFVGNRSKSSGGNFAGGLGSVARGCTFVDGEAVGNGGNFYGKTCRAIGCVFSGGRSDGYNSCSICTEGNIDSESSTAYSEIIDCVVTNLVGGFFSQGSARFRNTLFANFQPNADGVRPPVYLFAATRDFPQRYSFENCTFADVGTLDIDYYHGDFDSATRAVNTIFDTEIRGLGLHTYDEQGSHVQSLAATNCCFQALPVVPAGDDSLTLENCFAAKPRFVKASEGDYSIRRGSPCRDKGVFLDWITADAKDLAGNPRVVTDGKTLAENPDAKPDIGCYECLLVPMGGLIFLR